MGETIRYTVRDARWPEDTPRIRQVRELVFVEEQSVPADLEWDGLDADCAHVLAFAEDMSAIGTGRLQPDGKIGRMAVLLDYRGHGVGDALLRQLLACARSAGMSCCYLHSQSHAAGFYSRHGFIPHGSEFDEAGIPHIEMTLELGP